MVIDMAKRTQERTARIQATKERRKGEQGVGQSDEVTPVAETPETK